MYVGGYMIDTETYTINDEVFKKIEILGTYWIGCKGSVYTSVSSGVKKTDLENNIPRYVAYVDTDPKGYRYLRIKRKSLKKNFYIHNLVMDYFGPPKPNTDSIVRHLNDIRQDNKIDNLVWGTYKENHTDKRRNNKNYKLFYMFVMQNHPDIVKEYESKKLNLNTSNKNLYKSLS
jgi:hypothetical protein